MRVSQREALDLGPEYQYPCRRCNIVKHISNFSALHMKQWLRKERREETWACEDCQFPACSLCETENRPLYPVSHNAVRDGKYLCEEHRFPPCIECGRPRPEGRKKLRIVDWRCEDCRSGGDVQCCKCLQFKSCQEFDLRQKRTEIICHDCRSEGDVQCAECLQLKPRSEFGDTLRLVKERWKCLSCRRPSCRKCGKVVLSMHGRKKGSVAYCAAECRLPPCTVCSEPRPQNLPYHVCVDWKCTGCK